MRNPSKKQHTVQPKKMSVAMHQKTEPEYELDFFKWTQDQAQWLQKGEFEKLDRDHLREEIESLGISLQRALESYLTNLLMHQLKIQYQPAKRTNSWDNSIKNATLQIERLIKKNPSLKSCLNELYTFAYEAARLEASSETGINEKEFPKKCPWAIEELLPFVKSRKKRA